MTNELSLRIYINKIWSQDTSVHIMRFCFTYCMPTKAYCITSRYNICSCGSCSMSAEINWLQRTTWRRVQLLVPCGPLSCEGLYLYLWQSINYSVQCVLAYFLIKKTSMTTTNNFEEPDMIVGSFIIILKY